LFGGEFRNLAPRSTAVCSLRLQTSKRQSLRWEKHHACNIAAASACCWGGSMFQRKRKVTPETVCMQLFNSDERRQEVNGNARVDYLSLFLLHCINVVCPGDEG
jgi:hypothetical protein